MPVGVCSVDEGECPRPSYRGKKRIYRTVHAREQEAWKNLREGLKEEEEEKDDEEHEMTRKSCNRDRV